MTFSSFPKLTNFLLSGIKYQLYFEMLTSCIRICRTYIEQRSYKYKFISSSLTALGVRMPRSVNRRLMRTGGV